MVLTRSTNFDTPLQMNEGTAIFVNNGTVFGGRTITFVTSGEITIGTTPLEFSTDVFSTATLLTFNFSTDDIVGVPGTPNPIFILPTGRMFMPSGPIMVQYLYTGLAIPTSGLDLNVGVEYSVPDAIPVVLEFHPWAIDTDIEEYDPESLFTPYYYLGTVTAPVSFMASGPMSNGVVHGDAKISATFTIHTALIDSPTIQFYIPGQWIN
jgi:hypothetical protein